MIPSQQDSDFNDPEEHFAWALRNMPTLGGVGAVTHPMFLKQWSKHLFECGFIHESYLRKKADDDGNIHVSKLPHQTIKLQNSARGPHHLYNNGTQWVPIGKEDPAPVRIPNIETLTVQEKHALLKQFEMNGMVKDGAVAPDLAEIEVKDK